MIDWQKEFPLTSITRANLQEAGLSDEQIAQFTDDDIGSGSGVNLKGHEIRVNFGLTRFLAWENRLYIQNGLTKNNPAINYFVPLQQGYNTQFRIHSQFIFTF